MENNREKSAGSYDPAAIESKWQKEWERSKIYEARDFAESANVPKKFYGLIEFPYPSGDGLHVGHIRSNTAMDIITRKRRMEGFNVLYPIGWDAFGLPTENYAIKTGTPPQIVTKRNTDTFRRQLKALGFGFDWSREINTTNPEYYRWTQWIFLQLHKNGLAYKKKMAINWCPKDKIGLANEEVIDGKCERCGTSVEKREKEQWMLAITKYADRLDRDLDGEIEGLYKIPVRIDKKNPPVPGKKTVTRRTVHVLLRDPKTGKFLCLKWKKFPWIALIVGGIEEGEDVVGAALREVTEETGYKNLRFVRVLGGPVQGEYFAAHKDENRVAITTAVLFELAGNEQQAIAPEEKEKFDAVWMSPEEMTLEAMTCAELDIWFERINQSVAQSGSAVSKTEIDFLERIKTQQRNWIGRSEGVNFKCKIKDLNIPVEMYNSVPQAYCAETFTVIAPEHPLVKELIKGTSHEKAVLDFIDKFKKRKAADKFDIEKEMEGIFTGRYIENFAGTGRDLPIWVASYVVMEYGTGIVNCSAHDTRDFAFAKKYDIPLREVVEPLEVQTTGTDAVRPDLPFVERNAVTCLIKHWSEDKYLCLKYKANDWLGFVNGGIEGKENAAEAGCREITEETGYKNVDFVRQVGGIIHSQFYHEVKKVNRFGHFTVALFQLRDDDKNPIAAEEMALHDLVWLKREEVMDFLNRPGLKLAWERYLGIEKPIVKNGILTEPTEFKGREWHEVRSDIIDYLVKKGYAERKVNYKLRDWVFSRQRYWGEPIPMVYCPACQKKDSEKGIISDGWIPLPESALPLTLPEVKNYQPTDTGESPLAQMTDWVTTKCPRCSGPARRETDTMPNWAGSSWYYLRYADPHNNTAFAGRDQLDHWTPVDWYNGGMEHTTLHLLYSRFWHKFLFDQGLVPTSEPYIKRTSHGLILAADGEKMSKSRGNVINPDGLITAFGADSIRLYEMFMGPFDQMVAWQSDSIVGVRRFLERVWKVGQKVMAAQKDAAGQKVGQKITEGQTKDAPKISLDPAVESLLHASIKKIGEDIEAMRFNTCVSGLMILLNEFEKSDAVPADVFATYLTLLAPFAPHITEELWSWLPADAKVEIQAKIDVKNDAKNDAQTASIHLASWPSFDLSKIKAGRNKIAVQVNGKTRAMLELETAGGQELSQEELEKNALALPEIQRWTSGKKIGKVISVKGRLVNIVAI